MDPSEKAAEFVVRATANEVPPAALSLAKEIIIDGLGVAVAGTLESPSRIAARLAARNGVVAASLAMEGFTANSSILAERRGFPDVYNRGLSYDPAAIDSLGKSYELVERGVRFKAYPCGGLTHPALEAALELRSRRQFSAQKIDSIRVGVTAYTRGRIVCKIPRNGLEGKFSIPYVVARALSDGRVTLDAFTDESVREPEVISLAEKTSLEIDSRLVKLEERSYPCRVEIRLKDGEKLSAEVSYPKGSRRSPMSGEEIRTKFLAC